MKKLTMLSITKLQNLKAIHNFYLLFFAQYDDVINHKTTKFESNSQQKLERPFDEPKMLSITKLQNLKAIHNTITALHNQSLVVINHKTTKFESNSQPTSRNYLKCRCCYQSQNYKI